MKRVPFYLTWIAVAVLPVSITAMNIALAVAALVVIIWHFAYGAEIRLPEVKLPLGLLFVWTALSIAFSGHAAEGMEGIRKFFLFLMLPVVCSTVRTRGEVRTIVWGLAATTTLSAAWSLVQFERKYQAAHAAGLDFRLAYTAGERITGFMSHWMTLSGEEMIVLVLIAGMGLLGGTLRSWVLAVCGTVIAVSLAAGYTRSMWLGTALGLGFVVWRRDWRWLGVLPATAVLLLVLNPAGVGGRIQSAWRPAGDVDSNRFRVICRRTALEMMRAHPWFGVGPGQVRPQFLSFIPADIQRPLPPGAYIHMHNTYLQFGAERGIPALLALLWLLGKMVFDLWRARRLHPGDWVIEASLGAMLAVPAAGWWEHNLGNGEVLPLFLAAVACGYVSARELG